MSLKVIGAGFGRTGTMSLKLALEELGFGPCYHMVEVFKNPQAPAWWSAVADGCSPGWETIFEGYESTVDWPSATYWRELAEAYPEAKVVLTVRDPQAWFTSTQATIFSFRREPGNPLSEMFAKVIGRLFDGRMDDRDKLISVFEAHNAAVRAALPPERLLVWNAAEGWDPLCRFLGVAVPDGPMPKVNTTEEFQARLAQRLAIADQFAGKP